MADYTPYKYSNLMQLLGHGMAAGSAGAVQGLKNQGDLAQQQLKGQQALEKTEADKKSLAQLFGIDTKDPTPQPDNAPAEGQMGPPSPTPQQAQWQPPTEKPWQQQLGDKLKQSGAGFHIGDMGVTPDPLAKLAGMGPKEAAGFLKTASGVYKPITDQLDASKATLDYLNQKNAASDKLALISEARIAAGQGGSRAIKGIMDSLSGGKTAAMNFQDAMNYFNNTGDIPTMQDAQRDALREAVYGRLPQLSTMHSQAQGQLGQQGPIVAPHADYTGITNSFASPAQQRLAELNKMAEDYKTARAAMGSRQIGSGASAADPSPSALDKLMGFFGKKQPTPQGTPTKSPADRLKELEAKRNAH